MLRAADHLTRDEIARLKAKSDLMGAWCIAHAWILILCSMAVFAAWPNPLTFAAAVMVTGTRQLGLVILMHDAAHGLLFRNPKVNDWAANWLCAFPAFADLRPYRPYHFTHHKRTQQADDPDLSLSAPFPITRESFRRKLLRDITGQTAFDQRSRQLIAAFGQAGMPWRARLAQAWTKMGGMFLTNALLFAGLAAIGYWWLYPALWLVPLATWYQLVTRVRNIAEHAMVPDNDDPLRNARTTLAGPVARLLLAPYWVNYHVEHHALIFVPCYNLPAAHALLNAKGLGPRMEVRRGYREVIGLATSRAAA
jgi:fatty acid desaturase